MMYLGKYPVGNHDTCDGHDWLEYELSPTELSWIERHHVSQQPDSPVGAGRILWYHFIRMTWARQALKTAVWNGGDLSDAAATTFYECVRAVCVTEKEKRLVESQCTDAESADLAGIDRLAGMNATWRKVGPSLQAVASSCSPQG